MSYFLKCVFPLILRIKKTSRGNKVSFSQPPETLGTAQVAQVFGLKQKSRLSREENGKQNTA